MLKGSCTDKTCARASDPYGAAQEQHISSDTTVTSLPAGVSSTLTTCMHQAASQKERFDQQLTNKGCSKMPVQQLLLSMYCEIPHGKAFCQEYSHHSSCSPHTCTLLYRICHPGSIHSTSSSRQTSCSCSPWCGAQYHLGHCVCFGGGCLPLQSVQQQH